MKAIHIIGAGLIALAQLGCGSDPKVTEISEKSPPAPETKLEPLAPATPKVPLMRVSNRPPNPMGSVFIVEYHHIREGKTTMERSPADFRSDLERLYKLGFRPVGMDEYLTGKISLPPGASPVVFTFDDANPSQIQLTSEGKLDPKCGLGIMKEFADRHPDFPAVATFFVLPQMWGSAGDAPKKVELIRQLGGNLGNHTLTHPILRKLTDEQVKAEIAGGNALVKKFAERTPVLFAMPFGISPKNKDLLKGFQFKSEKIAIRAAFLVGANPAPIPSDPKFDPYRIPRIQACKGEAGLEDWLNQLEKGRVKVYVAP